MITTLSFSFTATLALLHCSFVEDNASMDSLITPHSKRDAERRNEGGMSSHARDASHQTEPFRENRRNTGLSSSDGFRRRVCPWPLALTQWTHKRKQWSMRQLSLFLAGAQHINHHLWNVVWNYLLVPIARTHRHLVRLAMRSRVSHTITLVTSCGRGLIEGMNKKSIKFTNLDTIVSPSAFLNRSVPHSFLLQQPHHTGSERDTKAAKSGGGEE
ncbi:hypothetical protein BLNAU_13739 [Blattamonas nauphoetae]|uniref:Secreted protein n=1 Tax=Blattamonas nauphoetae TaxID=2049346 RepID=A0ABQ9XJI0_9EUKA|nr:hypothetical protein BLNAU_13739 [Blattamonas nauphoetae]